MLPIHQTVHLTSQCTLHIKRDFTSTIEIQFNINNATTSHLVFITFLHMYITIYSTTLLTCISTSRFINTISITIHINTHKITNFYILCIFHMILAYRMQTAFKTHNIILTLYRYVSYIIMSCIVRIYIVNHITFPIHFHLTMH